uniref:Uncharacterized protein n=1 Tax=Catagonus wagneri TaxID=51154 RepID=A0A8C3VY24_9CETA
MTALDMEAQWLLAQRRPHESFFESFIWTLIILCAHLAVIPSSISICNGHWLLDKDRLFGLWHFCKASNQTALHFLRNLSQARVPRLAHSMAILAVLISIFGLGFLMARCGRTSTHKQVDHGLFFLVSIIFSFGKLLGFLILFRNEVTFIGLTLISQASSLPPSIFFILNAISGLHVNSITSPWGLPRKFSPGFSNS